MFRKFVISLVMYFALTTSVVGAGYTDDLWNESEDREYYDCADWSGVHNHKDTSLGTPYYFFSKHRSNWRSMFNKGNYGYPNDAKLKSVGFSDIAWAAVHINGFDKTLNVEGNFYTDDPTKINYKTSYLQYKGWSTRHWMIYDVKDVLVLSDNGDRVTVTNRITFYGKHAKDGKDDYKKVTSTPSDSINYEKWSIPDLEINATIIEHNGYSIINIPTPSDVVGIKITANGGTYEKYSHCLKLNSTSRYQYYDLVECDYRTFSGIFPYGSDKYLIDDVADLDLSVTLFTPFKAHNATIQTTVIERTIDEKVHLKNHPIFVLAMFLLPVVLSIWLYRRL